MLRKLREAIKGQSTAEYAILISLVVAAIIAMQTYAKRSLNARIRGAAHFMTNQIGNRTQYEPYYLQSSFNVTREQETISRQDINLVASNASTNVIREAEGTQTFTNYSTTPGE